MKGAPPGCEQPNLLGKLIYRDSNMLVPDREAAVDHLLRLRAEGWLILRVTDTAVLETSAASDPIVRAERADEIATGPVALGPMVLGHSLLGYSVLGSEKDQRRLEGLHEVIWRRSWEADATASGRAA